MKRLLRWAFNLAAVGSAVLFVAVCVLWVRSYRVWDLYEGPVTSWGDLFGDSSRGTITLAGSRISEAMAAAGGEWTMAPKQGWRTRPPTPLTAYRARRGEPGVRWDFAFAGFGLYRTDGGTVVIQSRGSAGGMKIQTYPRAWQVTLPYWSLAVLSAAAPAAWLWRRWRQGRKRPGLCPTCGYDLRATPGRCPECGAVCGAVPTTKSTTKGAKA